jgi:hypothetical protein
MFDKDLLSLAVGMNTTHRNAAIVSVYYGEVMVINGDATLVISYDDESLQNKVFAFNIGDFPDGVENAFASGSDVIFQIRKGNWMKTERIAQPVNHHKELIDNVVCALVPNEEVLAISPEVIEMLQDDISFFWLISKDGEISTEQFHGYSGKMSVIEADKQQPTFDSMFAGDCAKDFRVGCITDLWKFLYANLENISVKVKPGCHIHGTGTRGSKVVYFLISDAEWKE